MVAMVAMLERFFFSARRNAVWCMMALLMVTHAQTWAQAKQSANPDRLGAFLDKLSASTQLSIDLASSVTGTVLEGAQNLASVALSYLGVPYKYGGNTAEQGLDCSGFVKLVFERTAGMVLPRRSEEMSRLGDEVDKDALQAGDLVFYNTLRRKNSHVGIYIGDGLFVHAPSRGGQVRTESMASSYWQKRFDGAKRLINP